MRKIENAMIKALEDETICTYGKRWKSQNTEVTCNSQGQHQVFLHGNLIYEERENYCIITLARWLTKTTLSRLSKITHWLYDIGVTKDLYYIQQIQFEPYLVKNHNVERKIDDDEYVIIPYNIQ